MMHWPLPRLNQRARLQSDWDLQLAETWARIDALKAGCAEVRARVDRCHALADTIQRELSGQAGA